GAGWSACGRCLSASMQWRRVCLIVLALVAAGLAGTYWYVRLHGFSARGRPSSLEAFVALRLRRIATPNDAREQNNPVALTPEVLSESMAHFADHCSS